MVKLRSKIIYVLAPLMLLIGGIILVGSSNSTDNENLKGLTSHATTITLDPPNDLNFAGEIVPLHDFDVQERLDKELIRYIYYHSATIMNIKRAARWRPEMTKILRANNVPEDFFYLCVAESHLTNATSPAGAKGFWQFMKGTADLYGLEVSKQVDERYHPIKATQAACDYLNDAHRKFKNWTLVAASYNMGMGGLQKQLNKQKVSNYYDLYLNRETAAYVFRILAIKTVLDNPEAYGFQIRKEQLYSPLRYKTVTVDSTIDDLVAFAQEHGTTYKMLKVLNPWILGDKLTVGVDREGKKKSYKIQVPRDAKSDPAGADDLLPEAVPSDSTMVVTPDNPVDDTVNAPDTTQVIGTDSLEK